MIDSTTKQLLHILDTDKFVTGTQMAKALGVSERTIRTKLGELSEYLEKHGAYLEAKRRTGYRIEVRDQAAFSDWRAEVDAVAEAIPTTSDERVRFILSYLLNHDAYIKLDDLSLLLYISRNTVTADLKRAESILGEYHLTIHRRPNHGIRLEGSEFDRRICMAKQIIREDFCQSDTTGEALLLRTILVTMAKEFHFRMVEGFFQSMVIHLHVANERLRQGHPMVYAEEARNELEQSISSGVLTAAQRLAEELEKHTGVHYSVDETLYLAIHLRGKTASDAAGEGDGPDQFLEGQMGELATQMLQAVYEGNNMDFREDQELRKSLVQHLIPLNTRIRFGIPLTNPILDHIKTEYSFAFMVATTACAVLRAHYQRPISQGEIGYIAILFGWAIEKRDRVFRKRNIVVVCASGRGTSQLFLYKCRQAFGKYIGHIYERSVFELSQLDFKGLEIDCIFSTIPLEMPLPVPVYQVSPFLDSQEVEKLQRIFKQGGADFLSRYFDARLFLPRLTAETKAEVLKKMCLHAGQFVNLEEAFYPLVLKREEMGQTDFGNLVAIPHAYRIASPDRFVMTAILDKPIWWGHNEAQVIFLISLPEGTDDSAESFYRAMLNFQADPVLVQSVIETPTYTALMQAFREAAQR